jgi:hypothetical protein
MKQKVLGQAPVDQRVPVDFEKAPEHPKSQSQARSERQRNWPHGMRSTRALGQMHPRRQLTLLASFHTIFNVQRSARPGIPRPCLFNAKAVAFVGCDHLFCAGFAEL